jgi:hypothetical protein
MEIRGCAIAALSRITELVRELVLADAPASAASHDISSEINDVSLDNFLWVWGKAHLKELTIPAHNTRSTFY